MRLRTRVKDKAKGDKIFTPWLNTVIAVFVFCLVITLMLPYGSQIFDQNIIKIKDIRLTDKPYEKGVDFYDVSLVLDSGPIKSFTLENADVNTVKKLKIVDVEEKGKNKNFVEVYSIDPTEVDFEKGLIKVKAKNAVKKKLSRC